MTKKENYARVVTTIAKSQNAAGNTVLNGTQDNNSAINSQAVYSADAVRAYFANISSLFPRSTVTLDEFAQFLRDEGISVADEVN